MLWYKGLQNTICCVTLWFTPYLCYGGKRQEISGNKRLQENRLSRIGRLIAPFSPLLKPARCTAAGDFQPSLWQRGGRVWSKLLLL
jgi:hypothetical protein